MKKVFATGIIYICLFILLIISVYNIGKQLNESVLQSGEVVATTENSTSETEPEQEQEPEQEPKVEKNKIEDTVVVKGDISENVTPFNYKTTADQYLLDLCYAGLCKMKDRRCISKNVSSSYDKKERLQNIVLHLTKIRKMPLEKR